MANDYSLGWIDYAARKENGWRVLALAEEHPGGNGHVPHGIVLVERPESPLGSDHRFVVSRYTVRESGIGFEAGDYDLTREEANAAFIERAGLEPD